MGRHEATNLSATPVKALHFITSHHEAPVTVTFFGASHRRVGVATTAASAEPRSCAQRQPQPLAVASLE
jgi:hypothetical protein